MNVEIFALCDAANDSHGKLNLLGAFDSVWAKTVPAMHPACSVAVRLRFGQFETGEHRVAIHFIDEDGQMSMNPVEGAIQVNPRPIGHLGPSPTSCSTCKVSSSNTMVSTPSTCSSTAMKPPRCRCSYANRRRDRCVGDR